MFCVLFRVVMYRGSVMDELKTFESGKLLRRLYEEKIAQSMEESLAYSKEFNENEGLARNVRLKRWVRPGVAVIMTLNALMNMEEYPCEIVPLDIELIDQPNGFGFQKDSDLVPFFNYQLIKMKQSGLIENLRKKVSMSSIKKRGRVRY